MTTHTPRITVLMPVHNAGPFLREAIESVLGQSFRDFELLILDDGSTDDSIAIVCSYDDPRVRLEVGDANMGVAATLNRGLDLATGEYVARMDADDLCRRNRLATQVAFMDAHPEIGLSGTRALAFGAERYLIRHPSEPERIRCRLLFDTAFAHPTVIFRRSLMEAHGLRYGALRHFEDLELWQRASACFPCANLDEVLLDYRVTGGSAFHGAGEAERRECYRRIDRSALERFGIQPTEDELDRHHDLRRPEQATDLDGLEAWLIKLRETNGQRGVYSPAVFGAMLADYWFVACSSAPGWAGARWERFARSPLSSSAPARWRKRARCLMRSLAPQAPAQPAITH